jgi:hypothetical protein
MQVLQISARSDADGSVRLVLPVGVANEEFEFAIVVSPKSTTNGATKQKTPEELGWPPGFFEKTYGSIHDENFCRPPQPPFSPMENYWAV